MEEKKELTLEELRQKLEDCEKKKEEYLAGWQRTKADFLNYKREETERTGELLKYGSAEIFLKILPILDNFDVAIHLNPASFKEEKSFDNQDKKDKVIKGFLQIRKQLQDFLKEQGVEEIKSVGCKFDPNFHEVVEELKIQDKESGTIVQEIQKGYTMNGRLLRPAKVKVVK